METLESLKQQLKEETTYENLRREKAAEKKEVKKLRSQIRAKKFARTNPRTNSVVNGYIRPAANTVFKGLGKVGATTGKGIQRAAAETQRREVANKKARSHGKKRPGVYNMYGERLH